MEKAPLTESMENYLEAILALAHRHEAARAKDIAERLDVKPGTVTGALKVLAGKGLINYAPYSAITLTPEGAAIAAEIGRRHRVIRDFLVRVLHVPPENAEIAASRMEHGVEGMVLDRLVCFIDFVHCCPPAGDDLLRAFVRYCESGDAERKACGNAIAACRPRDPEEIP